MSSTAASPVSAAAVTASDKVSDTADNTVSNTAGNTPSVCSVAAMAVDGDGVGATPGASKPDQPPRRRIGSAEQLLLRLEWTVLKRLDGLLQGDYRSLWRGAGLDLADLREYQHGDDVRRIDWAATARLQQPHVRLYREDREVAVWFLLDLSASIALGAGTRSKLELCEEFTAVLARVMGRQGNPVGAVLYRPGATRSGHTVTLAPRSGRHQVLQIMARVRSLALLAPAAANQVGAVATQAAGSGAWRRVLQRVLRRQPSPDQSKPPGAAVDGTRLADLLAAAEGMIRRRSLVVVVSDFISAPGWGSALGRLARRHDVLAVRLTDPVDAALPDIGLLTLQDAETGEQLLVDSGDPAFRQRYAALAEQAEAELLDALSHSGVDTLELATDEDLLPALLRFVALRRQAGASHASLADRAAARGATGPVPASVHAPVSVSA